MSKIGSLQELFVEELRILFDAEKRLIEALPDVRKAIASEDLALAVEKHFAETEKQLVRLKEAFKLLDEDAKASTSESMKGLLKQCEEVLDIDYADDALQDAMMIGVLQQVEHCEIAAYGTALAHAKLLELEDVADLLAATLEEEQQADEALTTIADDIVNLGAADDGDDTDDTGSDDKKK